MAEVPFLQVKKAGIYCAAGDFYIDPQEPVQRAVITHAHADHACKGNLEVYCTKATSAFMQLRYGKQAAQKFYINSFQQVFTFGGVELQFIPAGHMLGSAQVLLIYQGIRYLFTGDFKLQPDETCEPYAHTQADVLITETTFGSPKFSHAMPEQEIQKLNADDVNTLLGAYTLGKAQRLTRLISDYCPEKKLLIHYRIYPYHKLYENLGAKIGTYQVYDRRLMKHNCNQVYIVPPFTFESYMRATGVKRIFATGWIDRQKGNDEQLYVSDHADWNDLLEVIEYTRPQEIWTHHGDGSHLKAHFTGKILIRDLADAD